MKANKNNRWDKINDLSDEEILELERKLYIKSILMLVFGILCFTVCISMFLSLIN